MFMCHVYPLRKFNVTTVALQLEAYLRNFLIRFLSKIMIKTISLFVWTRLQGTMISEFVSKYGAWYLKLILDLTITGGVTVVAYCEELPDRARRRTEQQQNNRSHADHRAFDCIHVLKAPVYDLGHRTFKF
jgi:uncharacterized membrane protein